MSEETAAAGTTPGTEQATTSKAATEGSGVSRDCVGDFLKGTGAPDSDRVDPAGFDRVSSLFSSLGRITSQIGCSKGTACHAGKTQAAGCPKSPAIAIDAPPPPKAGRAGSRATTEPPVHHHQRGRTTPKGEAGRPPRGGWWAREHKTPPSSAGIAPHPIGTNRPPPAAGPHHARACSLYARVRA